MKGDPKVIERLNEALHLELGAINQYWLHYRLLEDWGFKKLAAKEKAESIEEMVHADTIVERIIFLEGHPNLQTVAPLAHRAELSRKCWKPDLAGEFEARASYSKSRDICNDGWRLRDDEDLRAAADRRGRPYRLPRNPARTAREDRRRALRPS
jgi:bacterioferritin